MEAYRKIMNKQEKNAGLVAGISLLVMAIAAGFSYGFVHNELVNESAEITRQNLLENKSLFLAGLAGWIVIFITDMIVSVAMYVFFKNTSKRMSLITATIRIVYTMILGVAVFQLISIVPALSADESAIVITRHFEAFENIWSAGLIIFGIHLLGLGYLSVRSQFVPRLFGYLLYFAGAAYVFVHAAKQLNFLTPNILELTENVLALPMALSEILFAVWLIYKGLKSEN